MRRLRSMIGTVMVAMLLICSVHVADAEVMMTGSVSGFGFDVMPTSNFSPDEWFSMPGLWTLSIVNSADGRPIRRAVVHLTITSGGYGEILTGELTVVDQSNAYLTELPAGGSYTINNTMITDSSPQMRGGEFSDDFVDEVLRIGYLPEGSYTLHFTLSGYYEDSSQPFDASMSPLDITETIEIRNPQPPELVAPEDNAVDTVTIPRFVWQRPRVSDYSGIGRHVEVMYNISVWKMFTESGSELTEEDAINGIPIWSVTDWPDEAIDFNPGTAAEELQTGRRYCWQVQAFDGTGRPISVRNDGKSDVWQFTVQFRSPVLEEVTSFNPLRIRWSPAQTGGTFVQYRLRIADNPDFSGAYVVRGLVMTSFMYPLDAPPLTLGMPYYVEVQATDDTGMPVGAPSVGTFTLPSAEVALQQPDDGADLPTMSPRLIWQGSARYYMVTITDEENNWEYVSSAIPLTNWRYDGEDLEPGKTYSWKVTPADETGAAIGEPSEARRFTVPASDQVMLDEPLSGTVDSITPLFKWQPFDRTSASTVTYVVTVADVDGTPVYTGESSATEYQYPDDAPALQYGALYQWNVLAQRNGVTVSREGAPATFMTPFVEAGRDMVSLEDIQHIISMIIRQYPEYAGLENKILVSLSDETGPITPSEFLEMLESYSIRTVRSK